MLASILPGLREIRAPLAAGYVWLVIGWLVFHDRIETGASASGAVDALTELRDAIGLGGIAAAATFVAYVLGALWEPIAGELAKALWHFRGSTSIADWNPEQSQRRVPPRLHPDMVRWIIRAFSEGLGPREPPHSIRISPTAWNLLWLTGQRRFSQVDDQLAVRLGHQFDRDATEETASQLEPLLAQYLNPYQEISSEAIEALKSFESTSSRDSWWIREAGEFAARLGAEDTYFRLVFREKFLILAMEKKPGFAEEKEEQFIRTRGPTGRAHKKPGEEAAVLIGEAEVAAGLFSELPLMARSLVGEEQEHFLEASRQKGEVEFRYALALPLAIAVPVLLFGLGVPYWVSAMGNIGGLILGWALLSDGWRRDMARNDYLVELFAIGKAKSPTFERLHERAKQAVPGDAPIDEVGVREAATDGGSSGSAESAEGSQPAKTAGARAARTP